MHRSSPEFVEALFQLTRERGGGYILNHEIEARAATIVIKPRITLPRPAGIALPGIALPTIRLP